jgi:predicted transcriptional regulator
VETNTPDVKAASLAAFASQLRSWRLHMSWTQVEMGAKLGYSASLVSGVETMDKAPTADFAARCGPGAPKIAATRSTGSSRRA